MILARHNLLAPRVALFPSQLAARLSLLVLYAPRLVEAIRLQIRLWAPVQGEDTDVLIVPVDGSVPLKKHLHKRHLVDWAGPATLVRLAGFVMHLNLHRSKHSNQLRNRPPHR